MSISMHIYHLDKFYEKVLKVLSGNEDIMMDERMNERNDRRPKSYKAHPFQSRVLLATTTLEGSSSLRLFVHRMDITGAVL